MDEKGAKAVDVVGQINVNEAKVEDFLILPGLGAKKAVAIVNYIRENGPITRKKQLLNVPGVGESLLDTISPNIKLTGKSNARTVSVREISSSKAREAIADLERRKEELRKAEFTLREEGGKRSHDELVSLFTDIVDRTKMNMEQISQNLIQRTAEEAERTKAGLHEREEELKRLQEALEAKERMLQKTIDGQVTVGADALVERERTLIEKEEAWKREMADKDHEIDDMLTQLGERSRDLDRRGAELERVKEELLRKEVTIIIDEARYEEFRRKEREMADRIATMGEKEAEIDSLRSQLRDQQAKGAPYEDIERREALLAAREAGLRQMEQDLLREEQTSREETIRKEVDLMVREVEVEELHRHQEDMTRKEDELGRREETLRIWEENLRSREGALALNDRTIHPTPSPLPPATDYEGVEMALALRIAEGDRREGDLTQREAELRRRSIEVALRETRLEGLDVREEDLAFRIRAFQERQLAFMREVSEMVHEAKRIRRQLEDKRIDLQAREAILKRHMEGV